MNPRPFKVQGEAILRLRQKRTVIRQLTKQITAMSNLRGSLACLPVPDKGATHTVDETIKFLEKKRDFRCCFRRHKTTPRREQSGFSKLREKIKRFIKF